MRGMRERSERIGAQFRVWSRAEMGTRVEMSAPGRIAFRSPQGPYEPRWVIFLRRCSGRFLRKPTWLFVNTEKVVRKDSED